MTVTAAETRDPVRHGRRRWLAPLLAVVVCAVAAYLVYRLVRQYDLAEVATALQSVPTLRFLTALGFAACSYLCLTGFDALGVRYAGKSLAYPKIALTSFVSLSLGHNIGLSALSSGAVRYRFYSRWGLELDHVAKIVLFSGLTVGLGLATLGGGALILQPDLAGDIAGLSRGYALATGIGLLFVVGLYLTLCGLVRGRLHIRRWTLKLPPLRLAVPQVLIGTVNFACVAACLHQALLGVAEIEYLRVVSVYVIANGAVVISHVPGGLGVLESVVLLLLPQANVLAALVVFRIVYFLVPLALGSVALALTEIVKRRRS